MQSLLKSGLFLGLALSGHLNQVSGLSNEFVVLGAQLAFLISLIGDRPCLTLAAGPTSHLSQDDLRILLLERESMGGCRSGLLLLIFSV